MPFLNNYKIKTLILASVLITGMMSVEKVRSSLAQLQQFSKLGAMLDYAHVTYPLIPSFLGEEFYTRLYLGAVSGTQQALQQMPAYRQDALTNSDQFKQFINENQHAIKQFPALNNQVEIIEKKLSDLQIISQLGDEKDHLSKAFIAQFGREVHTTSGMINDQIRKLLMTLSEIVFIASSEQTVDNLAGIIENQESYFNEFTLVKPSTNSL